MKVTFYYSIYEVLHSLHGILCVEGQDWNTVALGLHNQPWEWCFFVCDSRDLPSMVRHSAAFFYSHKPETKINGFKLTLLLLFNLSTFLKTLVEWAFLLPVHLPCAYWYTYCILKTLLGMRDEPWKSVPKVMRCLIRVTKSWIANGMIKAHGNTFNLDYCFDLCWSQIII